jgi:hypothetical protein
LLAFTFNLYCYVAACLCASYVGGSLNYAATAQALGLSATPAGQAALAAGMAADNLAMAGFLAVLMAIPAAAPPVDAASAKRILTDGGAGGAGDGATVATIAAALAAALVVLEVGKRIAAAAGLAGGALGVASLLAPFVSAAAAAVFKMSTNRSSSMRKPAAASSPAAGADAEAAAEGDAVSVGAFRGGEAAGGALMLLFFAALGACADPRVALTRGGPVLAFIAVQLCVHLACCYLVGRVGYHLFHSRLLG